MFKIFDTIRIRRLRKNDNVRKYFARRLYILGWDLNDIVRSPYVNTANVTTLMDLINEKE